MSDGLLTEETCLRGETRSNRLVRVEDLGNLIREKRKAEQLTLEKAAQQSGVSIATLSRWERQHHVGTNKFQPTPDMRTLAAITRWLNVSIERVVDVDSPPPVHSITHREGEATPDIVEAHLRADRNLDSATAEALARVFRAAYEQFAHLSNTTPSQRSEWQTAESSEGSNNKSIREP